MDLYKFSFGVLAAANIGLGILQYRGRNQTFRPRANSSPRSPRSLPRRLSPDLGNSRSSSNASKSGRSDGLLFGNPFSISNAGAIIDEEKMLLNRSTPPLWTNVAERDREAAWDFQKTFFGVYVLVMAADWLQGPYLYTMYKDEKQLAERTVGLLFVAGFISAAVSASFAGSLADLHGRKKASLACCALYSCSCLTMISDSVMVLFAGRVLSGISSTLLYSCFETWMVHEFHARNMGACGMVLGKMMGLMTTVSSVVAILAGVASELVVGWSGTNKGPFMLAIACLLTAAWIIATKWTENYGSTAEEKEAVSDDGTSIKAILKDLRIVSLGIISCLFEGSMYLFIFFWSPAVKSSRVGRATTHPSSDPDPFSPSSIPLPPFGLVFATFMASMTFGAQLFTITTSASPNPHIPHHISSLASAIITGSLSLLLVSALSQHTRRLELTFWALCLFEAMVGIYAPSMAYLKGQMVPDAIRAKVYSLFRLPLNIFVVGVLALIEEGDRYRDGVFLACGGLLIVSYVIAQKFLG